MKNIVLWVGVKSTDENVIKKWKYGNYDWMDYSRRTWEYYCKKHGFIFIPYEKTSNPDILKYKVNWQRWWDLFDLVPEDYDQILVTDASIMIKYDAPDLFQIANHKFSALRGTENFTWTYQSVEGYKKLFNDFDFKYNDYIASGFIIFSKKHEKFWKDLKQFYFDNEKEIIRLEDEIVKRGRDQPIINYLLQMKGINVNFLSIKSISHLYRWQVLGGNWQLQQFESNNLEHQIPFFIKYFDIWIFSGYSDRGETRNKLMKQTWDIVKNNYNNFEELLNKTKHKDTAKYTTSRKFKRDILETFMNDKFKDKTILELGCSQGKTTIILSHIFKKVIAVDFDDWNLDQAKKHCNGRNNIEFVKMDIYNDDWNFPKDVAVVFIDANHTTYAVKSDIENSLKHFNNPVMIFDDFGLPPGNVKFTIENKIKEGKLKIDKFIGEKPEDLKHAAGTKFFDMEGVICNLT